MKKTKGHADLNPEHWPFFCFSLQKKFCFQQAIRYNTKEAEEQEADS